MRKFPFLVLLAGIAVTTGCHKAPKPVQMGTVLPNVPLPPGGEALVHEGGTDALQLLFVSPVSPDSMVSYYRGALSTGAFRLINERVSGKTTAFYAEQDGPSIWVTVSPNGADGSQIIIAGAKASDTPAAKKP